MLKSHNLRLFFLPLHLENAKIYTSMENKNTDSSVIIRIDKERISIPEYVSGIPTKKDFIKERRQLIDDYYKTLWKHTHYIHNDFLDVDVHIKKNESDKKVKSIAPRKWQSTYAVKHLDQVVKNARPLNGIIEYDKPKTGTQSKNGYKQMVILYHKFTSNKYDYLNFTIKLTLGINTDGKYIQYSINKVEVQ